MKGRILGVVAAVIAIAVIIVLAAGPPRNSGHIDDAISATREAAVATVDAVKNSGENAENALVDEADSDAEIDSTPASEGESGGGSDVRAGEAPGL